MPRPVDEAKPDTVPDPEMNPLRNRLLAANMGRWAEVYFTTAPEKRAEAVAELIRQLEQEEAGTGAAPAQQHEEIYAEGAAQDVKEHEAQDSEPLIERETLPKKVDSYFPAPDPTIHQHASTDGIAAAAENAGAVSSVVCDACGGENSYGQKFCVMCGLPLDAPLEPLNEPLKPATPEAVHESKPFREPEPFAEAHSYMPQSFLGLSGGDEPAPAAPDSRPLLEREIPRKNVDSHFPPPDPTIRQPASSRGIAAAAGNAVAVSPVLCDACGEENSLGQRFCVKCGLPLDAPLEPVNEPAKPAMAEAVDIPEPVSAAHGYMPQSFLGLSGGYQPVTVDEQNQPYDDLAALRAQHVPQFALEPRPVPYRYRLYVGIVLAVLLGALFYVGWRGTLGSHSAALIPAPQPAPAASEPSSAAPSAPATAPEENSNPVPSSASPATNPAPLPAPAARNVEPTPMTARKAPERTPALRIAAKHEPEPASVSDDQTGQDELVAAEKYLNRGPSRNSGEAAALLWRAVGKGNVAATVTLSDLYLHGDGVPKSCDQAHLLLVAAARKGAKGAAERLRNLQAFGCR